MCAVRKMVEYGGVEKWIVYDTYWGHVLKYCENEEEAREELKKIEDKRAAHKDPLGAK